jgi:hypothetical protein
LPENFENISKSNQKKHLKATAEAFTHLEKCKPGTELDVSNLSQKETLKYFTEIFKLLKIVVTVPVTTGEN